MQSFYSFPLLYQQLFNHIHNFIDNTVCYKDKPVSKLDLGVYLSSFIVLGGVSFNSYWTLGLSLYSQIKASMYDVREAPMSCSYSFVINFILKSCNHASVAIAIKVATLFCFESFFSNFRSRSTVYSIKNENANIDKKKLTIAVF